MARSEVEMGTKTQAEALQTLAGGRGIRWSLGLIAFVLATVFAAQVAVPLPMTAVPMTLQPMLVLLAGAVLGPWLGAYAMATYLVIGLAGAPVFAAGGSGLAWLMGPTGGYLVSYPAAAFLVGMLAGRRTEETAPSTEWARLAGALVLGMATIYVGGISQLVILTGEPVGAAIAAGMLPFLIGDATKVVIALLIAKRLRASSLGRF